MKPRSFLRSVVLPLVFILTTLALFVLIVGCEPPQGSTLVSTSAQTLAPKPPCVKVLAFTATWCTPCRQAKPLLAQIKAAGVDVQIIDIDEQPKAARDNGVTSVPTFFVRIPSDIGGPGSYRWLHTQDISIVVSLVRARYK